MPTFLRRHGVRIAIALVPVALAVAHAVGAWHLPFVERLDNILYDVRLRATLPGTLDERIVIVHIDEASLAQYGQWPWGRDQVARLASEILTRQEAALLAFDVVFAEPDRSSGIDALRQLARDNAGTDPDLPGRIETLAPTLDRDARLARTFAGRPVLLGYYFSQTDPARHVGVLPAPLLMPDAIAAAAQAALRSNGFVGSLPILARAAPLAGFINLQNDEDDDGVVRSAPLLARYAGPADVAPAGWYGALALMVYQAATGLSNLQALHADPPGGADAPLTALVFNRGESRVTLAVDPAARVRVPYRGPGWPAGGSFRYVSAAQVLDGSLPLQSLKGRIVLVGATAPGLLDLRATPVGARYPGVEIHANLVSAMLDGRLLSVPDYAVGYDVLVLLAAGLGLAIGLTMLPARRAIWLVIAVLAALVAANTALYIGARLVLPLAASLLMALSASAASLVWGYRVEQRARRRLVRLFGTYVPPELVDEMLVTPGLRFSMRAESREITVLFCDMRGFTRLSEQMPPLQLQAFLNTVFSRLTEIISAHRGTVDKYMGDCVMAFWGAPVPTAGHASLAVQAAIDMAAAARQINQRHREQGLPEFSVGIGINTGVMSVGDMGSTVRRSYTVVGDAVNLASRLEGLCDTFGVDIVAGPTTRAQSPGFAWQELDRVAVRGKAQTVSISTPVGPVDSLSDARAQELDRWRWVLSAYRAQDWAVAQAQIAPLLAHGHLKILYQMYAERLASLSLRPKVPAWDGATRFDAK